MNILTANINYYRSIANKTKTQIATYLGISRVTFQRKCEKESFTVKELRLIAQYLKTTIQNLLKGV